VVETSYSSGNYSQHSPPNCWWRRDAAGITSVPASAFTNTGGQASTDHGKFHYSDWGDASHSLVASSVSVTTSGEHLFQVVFGNGAGPESTGITCAVKRLKIVDEQSTQVVGEGALVMPHLGSWDRWRDSNFVTADLVAGRNYRVTIESDPGYSNMSVFSHFASYTGGNGGSDGEFNRVNIAEIRILAR
jgi:hypothetical protein